MGWGQFSRYKCAGALGELSWPLCQAQVRGRVGAESGDWSMMQWDVEGGVGKKARSGVGWGLNQETGQ